MTGKQVRGKYTLEYKLEAVRQIKAGRSVAEVARVLGMPKATLSSWIRQGAKGDLAVAGELALKGKTTLQAMKQWYSDRPDLFVCRPYDHPRLDS